MKIRKLEETDIHVIVSAFENSGWQTKPSNIFERYLNEQNEDKRICFVVYVGHKFAGYVTLKWHSEYKRFYKNNIPEISDLNVLPVFRRRGIGSALIKRCEELAANKSDFVGIGVGLYSDYGEAQRLYVKHGYIPDGEGVTYDYEYAIPGKEYQLDDELILWFTKKLSRGKY